MVELSDAKVTSEMLRDRRPSAPAPPAQLELADMSLLQAISTELISEQHIDRLYEKIVDAAVILMRADFGTMQMLHRERGRGGELRLLASRGLTAQAMKYWEWVSEDTQSSCGIALHTGTRVVVTDVEEYAPMAGTKDLEGYRQIGLRAMASTPLRSRAGSIIGMISTHWRTPNAPADHNLHLLDILARQAADLIERAQSEEALERLAAENARLYQQAQQALEARNQALSQVVHDLKNAVAAIAGTVQLLELQHVRETSQPDSRLTTGLRRVNDRAWGMTSYLNELLDAAQLAVGKSLALDCQATDLAVLAHEVAADFQVLNPGRTINVSSAPSEVVGYWDHFRLERVLRNLLSNAIKYSPSGTPVSIVITSTGTAEEPLVQLVVQDHGVGIPADDLPRIFEPFHRGRNAGRTASGTGLGLAGTRAIIEQHSGTISLASTEGVGTTVTVRLPLGTSPRATGSPENLDEVIRAGGAGGL